MDSQYKDICDELARRIKRDQEMRAQSHIDGSWDKTVDKENTEAMKVIVKRIGWPTISKVGAEASKHAFLLVQHADHDVDFQVYCLQLMLDCRPDIRARDIAYLTDRINVNLGRNQVYGTQFMKVKGRQVPRPIDDIARVNERRREMGLGTLQEAIEEMNEDYPKDKPKPWYKRVIEHLFPYLC